jgi:hypothetical protein
MALHNCAIILRPCLERGEHSEVSMHFKGFSYFISHNEPECWLRGSSSSSNLRRKRQRAQKRVAAQSRLRIFASNLLPFDILYSVRSTRALGIVGGLRAGWLVLCTSHYHVLHDESLRLSIFFTAFPFRQFASHLVLDGGLLLYTLSFVYFSLTLYVMTRLQP